MFQHHKSYYLLKKMEPIHIFYKELTVAENNIFTANINEKNEVENVRFKKSVVHAVTRPLINQDINTTLIVGTDMGRQNVLSNLIQKFV